MSAEQPRREAVRVRTSRTTLAESLGVLASPALAFFVLRLRLMPVPDLNDPAMHTTFIIDPRSIFLRYAAAFSPTERLREAARVAFLVPGRIAYLLFGALPGFVVFRYLLALVAVVPAYLLLRRLYGRPAGVVGGLVILSSPVFITAWGTDYPNAAALSYLVAGLACLMMPSRRRVAWVAASAGFLTMAVWSIATSAPLVLVILATYLMVRLGREPARIVRDAAVMAAAAVAVTGLLALGSGLLLGQFDFILPTIQSVVYLSDPSLEALYHSASWRWAPFVAYLLVPPAIVGLWLAAIGRRLGTIPTPQLVIGVSCVAQFLICVLLQFAGQVQILEVHYFSSLLWAGLSLLLAISLVEFSRPILEQPPAMWALPVVLLVVPLAYELDPNVPAFGWLPFGDAMLAALAALAVLATRLRVAQPRFATRLASCLSLALISGSLLVLTVSPIPAHAMLPGTIFDPTPAYASALGGDASPGIDDYLVTAELPGFVGPATYSGEQLLIWWPPDEQQQILGPIGIYHAFFDTIPGKLGTLSSAGRQMIEERRPAQILLLSFTGRDFEQSLSALNPFQPRLERTGVLRSGAVALHVWLIDLDRYYRGQA
jgi:hypothetical protein